MKTTLLRAGIAFALSIGFIACSGGGDGGGDGGGGGEGGEGGSGAGGAGGGGSGLGQLDPRCKSLCSESDAACASDVAECEQVCQVRVAGMSGLCATCLLEGSNGGTCGGGETCCPDPEFPSSVLDCASICSGSAGVNPPSNHPICASICSVDDAACSADVTQCLQECHARIQDVSGVCALCLLDGAHGGTCGPDGPCCPDPVFPTAVSTCADLCGG